jgi:hypothetical protein
MQSLQVNRGYRIFNLIMVDAIFCLFVIYLIADSPKRWPILFVFVPLFLLANLFRLRLILRNRQPVVSALAVIYGCGFLYGLIWTIAVFEWWKIPLLLVPLSLSLYHAKRFRSSKRPN